MKLFKNVIYLIRYILLNLNPRVECKRIVKIGTGVKIIVEKNARLVINRSVYLKDRTVLYVKNGASLVIGSGTSTGHHTEVSVNNSVLIGDDVIMGAYVYITDSNHSFEEKNILIKNQGMDIGQVEIGNNVWIGRGVYILKGSNIGNRSVIGAKALVNKSFNDGVIIGGVPGKIIREI